MEETERPRILLLDGDYSHTLPVAAELAEDLRAIVIGVGTRRDTGLLRSKYCSRAEVAPPASSPDFPEAIRRLAEKHQPDLVLGIGYRSIQVLDALRQALPSRVHLCLPPSQSLYVALDKRKTLAAARKLEIPVPADYTSLVRHAAEHGREGQSLRHLPFPVFLKAALEAGHNISARVDSASDFWPIYARLRQEAEGGEVLVQECIEANLHTLGCGLLFINGEVVLSFAHHELRSVPRRGGSGTRVRQMHDPQLEEMSIALLRSLDWNGVALVEYKRRADGSPVLMEINPKFWASYALASRCGYHFASTLASKVLGVPLVRPVATKSSGEMVFPMRELAYSVKNRHQESFLRSARAMLWPVASWDVDLTDLPAWVPLRSMGKLARTLLGKG